MISTGQIDQTHRALAATQPSLLTLPFRFLPTWALVALVLVAAYCGNQLLAAYKLRAKAERYRIERRRKAGIPDSDKREFRLAAADVLRSRKIEDERRERERTLRKRASRPNGDWERFGTINGLRERPNQGSERNNSFESSIHYPSLSSAVSKTSPFANDEFQALPVSQYGDSDDERRELVLREKLSRRARGEGYGDEPILTRSATRPSVDSSVPPALMSSRSASKRLHANVTDSSWQKPAEANAKRPVVKLEPMSDDIEPALAAPPQQDRTRKRDVDEESATERDVSEGDDELMSSGSERLVRPPVRKAPRKKLRRRQRSASASSSDGSKSGGSSDADMGSATDPEGHPNSGTSDDDRPMSIASRSSSPVTALAPRSDKKTHKRVLSEVGSISSSRPRSSLAKKRRKSLGSAPAPVSKDEADEHSAQYATRQASWEDSHGIKFRTGADGRGSERLVLVKKQVRKFDMPADSEHPDREQTISANIEQWVNEQEFAELKARRALAWQSDNEDEAEPTTVLEQASQSIVDGVNTSLLNSSTLGRSPARKGALYVAKKTPGTPLRPSQSLTQMHELYTSSGLFSTASSRPASPASSTVGTPKATGGVKLRFSSAAARVRGSPFSASLARQAKEAEEQKRLDEELARKVEEEKNSAVALKSAPAPAHFAAPTPASASGLPSLSAAPSKESLASAPASIPTPASGVANPSATSSLAPSPAVPTNPFGVKPVATSQQPAAGDHKPASGGFSFGAPAKTTEKPASAEAPKASFSFGASASAPLAEPQAPQPPAVEAPVFAFAAPSSTSAAPSTPSEAPKAPSFSFGAPAASSLPPAATPAAAASFSFGTSASKPKEGESALTKQPSFSFGGPAPPAATSTSAAAPAPSFSFGASALNTTTAAAPAAAPASGGFSFGAAGKATPSAAPSFSFGGKASSLTTPSLSGAPMAPSFGAGLTSSAPEFSFGSATVPAVSSSTPAPGGAGAPGSTAAPSFVFGAKPADSASSAAPKATFSFGGAGGGSGNFSFGK